MRLDESKMPLEKFDTDEYETHSPEEWIALAQEHDMLAHTPKYVSGEWTWVRCKVLSYDHSAERYRVAFCDEVGNLTGGEKDVKRLSLRFDVEEKARFELRKESAKERRERTKAAVGLQLGWVGFGWVTPSLFSCLLLRYAVPFRPVLFRRISFCND